MKQNFRRVRNTLDCIICSTVILSGITVIIIPTSIGLNILGICLMLFGIILFLTTKSGFQDCRSGICFSRKIKYFPTSHKDEIIAALKSNPAKFDWSVNEVSSGLRVDIYINRKRRLVFVHCLEYVPYSYKDCSDWFAFELEKTGNLAD